MTGYSELKRLAEAAQAEEEKVIKLAADGEGWQALPAQSSFRSVASPAAVLALIAENERLSEEVALDDKIIAERDRLLAAIPQCMAHGACVPYAVQWVKDIQCEVQELREDRDGLKAEVESLRKDAERLVTATDFVQRLYDSAGKQPSVATGYMHDILSAMSKEPGK